MLTVKDVTPEGLEGTESALSHPSHSHINYIDLPFNLFTKLTQTEYKKFLLFIIQLAPLADNEEILVVIN